MTKNFVLLILGACMYLFNPTEAFAKQDPAITVYLFKSYSAEEDKQPANAAEKIYFSNRGKPLSEEGVKKALSLHKVIEEKGPFNKTLSGSNLNAVETAILATTANSEDIRGRVESAYEGKNAITVNQNWRQVDLGSFEGVKAGEIQKAYERTHPEAKYIPEPNDCLNYPWEGQREYHFEPYNTAFKERILNALKEIEKTNKPGDKVVVFTVSEPIRTAMLLSRPTQAFKETKFFKQVLENPSRTDKTVHADTTLDVLANRFNLKPNDGSWIKIEIKDGKIYLAEVSEGVVFRNEAPVPGYQRPYLKTND
jgi:broad specificity phosphatase PhoE